MIILVFACYFALMLFIGYWAYSSTKNLDDFILGGRSLGPLPAALSAGASDMSGWLLLGLPGLAFIAGVEALWMALGLIVGTWANWQFLASPLRKASEKLNDALTLPDYFASRSPEHAKSLRFISAGLILLFFLFYTSSGLVAGGKLFESVLNVDYQLAVTLGLVTIVAYTMFGGFLAVTWTDVIQAALMICALVALPIIAVSNLGYTELAHIIDNKNPELLNVFTSTDGSTLGFISIASMLAWGLGYFGQPHVLSRFMAIKNAEALPAARNIAVSWTLFSLIGALCVGFVGIGYFSEAEIDRERVFIEIIYLVTHPAVAGLLLAAILAAIMSTADSQLLVASSALSNDIYRVIFKDATPNKLVWVGRVAVVVVAVGAWLLALNPESSVLSLVSYAWAGFGAAFGPAILLSLYWKRVNGAAMLAGFISGAATVVIWKQLSGGWFELYEIVPGFVISTTAIIVVTLATSKASNPSEA